MKQRIRSASTNEGIPISVSIGPTLEAANDNKKRGVNSLRLLYICSLAVINALLVGIIAKVMVYLIGLVTSVSFYGTVSGGDTSPAENHLGIWVILVPVFGGIIVGLMARYGSRAIRGHGIPEAMEQVLTNESKIKPIVTLLKPLSAAVSIGTGGPFGAEGPIIAAGGAFGSLTGQLLHITASERKILLSAGATAGMSAIFGSPVAAIMLAIELLLFEFSPRSVIPVALACITGDACHLFFFGAMPMFSMPDIPSPDQFHLILYILIGAVVGVCSVGVTKIVYLTENLFEKLPIHWMWWPAIGGIAVGIVGYFAPSTMGVGYTNISAILSGNLALNMLLTLCILKFISWCIALGSGTSGGTLAPLFTIGGATGALIVIGLDKIFPSLGLSPSIAGLIGMAAMFSGASRAFITSVIFALETTGQPHLLLPLLGGCAAAYCISYLMMKSTIMTEKIEKRGVHTPDSLVPDILNALNVQDILKEEINVFDSGDTVEQLRRYVGQESENDLYNTFAIIEDKEDGSLSFSGIIRMQQLFSQQYKGNELLANIAMKPPVVLTETDSLQEAVDSMLTYKLPVIPVVNNRKERQLAGIITYRDIMESYRIKEHESLERKRAISLRREGRKLRIRMRRWVNHNID